MTVNIYCVLTVYQALFLSIACVFIHLFLINTFEIGTIILFFLQNEDTEALEGSEN